MYILLHLTTSNPWKGLDCGRGNCLLCGTKEKTGKLKKQCCKRRSLEYEIWCMECHDDECKRIDDEDD